MPDTFCDIGSNLGVEAQVVCRLLAACPDPEGCMGEGIGVKAGWRLRVLREQRQPFETLKVEAGQCVMLDDMTHQVRRPLIGEHLKGQDDERLVLAGVSGGAVLDLAQSVFRDSGDERPEDVGCSLRVG